MSRARRDATALLCALWAEQVLSRSLGIPGSVRVRGEAVAPGSPGTRSDSLALGGYAAERDLVLPGKVCPGTQPGRAGHGPVRCTTARRANLPLWGRPGGEVPYVGGHGAVVSGLSRSGAGQDLPGAPSRTGSWASLWP